MDNNFERPITNKKKNEYNRIGNNVNKIKKTLKISKFVTVFAVTFIFVFSSQVLVSDQGTTSWFSNLPIVKHIKHLAESADRELKGEKRDRINILLIGMGGRGHEGGYLADTIILASLEPSTQKVAMTSIPRDLAIPVEDMGLLKINHINAYAEADGTDGGLATSQAISDVLGAPVDYYVRVDFQGFVDIIDILGGLDVYVENTINDESYPIAGKEEAEVYEDRFEHLYIEKGWHEMDGTLALKYARSRHTPGYEGSDFARAARQQKIIEAVKDKLLSMGTLLNPQKISDLINESQEDIDTNLKFWEMIKLWSNFKEVKKEDIVNKVLDNSVNGLLTNRITEEGAYILSPKSGDFSEIQYFINSIFSDAPEEQVTKVSVEEASIEVRNGTWINGLASKNALDLERAGFDITRIGNSSRQNFEKSVIYDLTYGEKMESLSVLKEKTDANISFGLPEWLVEDIGKEADNNNNIKQPDFILILGQDADSTRSGLNNLENL